MSDSNNTTVLVVDDEPDLAMLYETYLSAEFDVRSANDGQQALDQVDQTVDVALLDRRMPQMSGDELLRRFREQGYEMKVAMLTAVEPDTDIVDMPFNDYKVKPVGRDELIGLVRTLLQRSTYDKQSQEFFSLASKKAALEIAGNDDTPEYKQLVEQIAQKRTEIDTTLDTVGAEAAFRDLSSHTI